MKCGKLLVWLLVLLVVVTCSMAACSSQPAPSPAQPPAVAPSPTSAPSAAPVAKPAPLPAASPTPSPVQAQAKPIELRFAQMSSPASVIAQISQRWADRIKEQTKDKVKITCYFGESLVKQTEALRAAQTGVANIVLYNVSLDTGLHNLSSALNLPFMGLTSMAMASATHNKLWSKFPEMAKEFSGVRALGGMRFMPGNELLSVKKTIRVPADLKGMKIIARADLSGVINEANGATLSLLGGDWYPSLERGLAEGQIVNLAAAYNFKLLDVCKNLTFFEGGINMSPEIFLMNMDTWNSLTPDVQKIFEEVTNWRTEEIIKSDVGEVEKALNYAKTKGNAIITPSAEELKLWMALAKPSQENWIKTNEAKGLPAGKVYEEAQRLINESRK